jgi:hypothetical protein
LYFANFGHGSSLIFCFQKDLRRRSTNSYVQILQTPTSTMTRARALQPGEGAQCSVLISCLHPKDRINKHIVNWTAVDRLHDLIAIRKENTTRRGRTYPAIFFTSESLPGEEVYCAVRYVKVTTAGRNVWGNDAPVVEPTAGDPAERPSVVDNGVEIDREVLRSTNRQEDIDFVRAQGLDVDDDNDPAPENIPQADDAVASSDDGLYDTQTWGWNGVDERRIVCPNDVDPGFNGSWSPLRKSLMDIFLMFLPHVWLFNVCMKHTSDALEKQRMQPLHRQEFLRYIGLWLLMSTCIGWTREQFFDTGLRDPEGNSAPYDLGQYMSKNRFNCITRELRFTSASAPSYRDRFWEVREMIAAWNENMKSLFLPGWVTCLDESISIWFSRYTCPGWVFCPRKPHPFGNEYHTHCCGITGILFAMEMVEGKDRPSELGDPKFESSYGKTGGLLLRLCENIWGSCRYVVLDSGFCVLQGLAALRQRGVFAGALIKKRRYWPKHVPGQAMAAWFADKAVGYVGCVSGVLNSVKYTIWAMKEPNYIMKIMATGGNIFTENCRRVNRVVNNATTSFSYPWAVETHFLYRHAVDDHNNLRHALPSIEDTWRTDRWPCRVFSFIIAVSEVNAYLAKRHWCWAGANKETYAVFRRKLAFELINNVAAVSSPCIQVDRLVANSPEAHRLEKAPNHALKWHNRQWVLTAKYCYQTHRCSTPGCTMRCRTFCSCEKGVWLCKRCHWEHLYNIGSGSN